MHSDSTFLYMGDHFVKAKIFGLLSHAHAVLAVFLLRVVWISYKLPKISDTKYTSSSSVSLLSICMHKTVILILPGQTSLTRFANQDIVEITKYFVVDS